MPNAAWVPPKTRQTALDNIGGAYDLSVARRRIAGGHLWVATKGIATTPQLTWHTGGANRAFQKLALQTQFPASAQVQCATLALSHSISRRFASRTSAIYKRAHEHREKTV